MTDHALAPDEVDSYQRNGYLFPLDVLDDTQVADIVADLEQAWARHRKCTSSTRTDYNGSFPGRNVDSLAAWNFGLLVV